LQLIDQVNKTKTIISEIIYFELIIKCFISDT